MHFTYYGFVYLHWNKSVICLNVLLYALTSDSGSFVILSFIRYVKRREKTTPQFIRGSFDVKFCYILLSHRLQIQIEGFSVFTEYLQVTVFIVLLSHSGYSLSYVMLESQYQCCHGQLLIKIIGKDFF